MPTEIRQLSFDMAEVTLALTEFNRRCGEPMPIPGLVTASADGPQSAEINFTTDNPIRPAFAINRERIAAALIFFCRLRKIPLPRTSRKTIALVRGEIILNVVSAEEGRVRAAASDATRGM